MAPIDARAGYYTFLIKLLAEADRQLDAESDGRHPERYGEHLAELRQALEVAMVSARFILADLKSDPATAQMTAVREADVALH
jgi:hypothetical protein